MAVCELNDDMISVKPNTTRLLIKNDTYYSEAAHVFYRDGYYYFTWSKNDTRSVDYEVRYVRSKSPVGPIEPSESQVILARNRIRESLLDIIQLCNCRVKMNGGLFTIDSSRML